MNELAFSEPKTMTTKELAEALGVSVDTVQRTANRLLDPSAVLRKVVNGGESKAFTEEQATAIKLEIQKHHNLENRQIDFVSTEYEENLTIANALTILQRRNDEYKSRMEKAERLVIEQKPKVAWFDAVADSANLTEISTVGKMVGVGAEKIFKLLSENRIVYKKCDSDGIYYYVPFYDYEKYFRSIPSPFMAKNKRFVRNKLMFTQNGVIWATKRFKAVENER